MSLLYQHELRVRLSERRSRLYRATSGEFGNELLLFLRWIDEQPYLVALTKELDAIPITLDEWESQGGVTNRGISFPNDEAERAKICLAICRTGELRKWPRLVSNERMFADQFRDFVEVIVDPLVNYLHDRLEDGGSVLAVLERYKRRTEWFHQQKLHDKYTSDTARGEASLDNHLREYLVDQGIAYPFSQPRSPSGSADVVADLGGDDPLALEIKHSSRAPGRTTRTSARDSLKRSATRMTTCSRSGISWCSTCPPSCSCSTATPALGGHRRCESAIRPRFLSLCKQIPIGRPRVEIANWPGT